MHWPTAPPHEIEAVALDRHIFGEALEFLGGFQSGALPGLDREHIPDEGIVVATYR